MKTNIKINQLVVFLNLLLFTIFACKKNPTIPKLTTEAVSGITQTSAVSGGVVIDDGGIPIINRGLCWGTSQNPDTSNSKTIEKGSTGFFSSQLTSLISGTLYYVRAYATNEAGTGYGGQVSFTTDPVVLPDVLTDQTTSVTSNSAIAGGIIASDGGAELLECGVCWGTSPEPTIQGQHIPCSSCSGEFVCNLEELEEATLYYVRAYAVNESGTAYGDELSFRTLLSDIEGSLYETIVIGTQVWMAENLKTTRYSDNEEISLVTDNQEWSELLTPGYCWYDNDDTENRSTYGALYNWYAINTGKLCPSGWHIPTDAEWSQLIDFLGGEIVAGGKLKKTGTDLWASPNKDATGESGFSAVPAGVRHDTYIPVNNYGVFEGLRLSAWFTAFNEASSTFAYWLTLNYTSGEAVLRDSAPKNIGFSVRCLKD